MPVRKTDLQFVLSEIARTYDLLNEAANARRRQSILSKLERACDVASNAVKAAEHLPALKAHATRLVEEIEAQLRAATLGDIQDRRAGEIYQGP